ncbi:MULTISPECIES: aromatic ring-hydroxylating dioxygenase subunit alpha [unclassified Synechococcus]|uniref:aromatic ring-hydroxylating oxygenase subunit alpha n=1 Tax=Synechococcales TaxID=1890424 RepID=UPI0016290003|nr:MULTISPECIES: SRPBCC family protein [unclassified Synechococcus]
MADSGTPFSRRPFLEAELYRSTAVAGRERQLYAPRFWHPVAPLASLPEGSALALELLDLPLLLCHPPGGPPRAFINRCPHRGVALLPPAAAAQTCRRLVCPYHGWTYDLDGRLRAAAREGEFTGAFSRHDWPLIALASAVRGSMLWVAIGPDPLPLEQQLDLVEQELGGSLERPRVLLASLESELACNWKIAHDNTLDDYHVAIAHPTTLHRQQGPVRLYRHRFAENANLLATPVSSPGRSEPARATATAAATEFLTFGAPPWIHLLAWPDGRLALISFPPLAQGRCRLQVWLLGDPSQRPYGQRWIEELRAFLEEDRALVESAQRGYASGLTPGPAHRLERRILHHQALYARIMELEPPPPAPA